MLHSQVLDAAMLREGELEYIVASNNEKVGRPLAPRPQQPNVFTTWRALHEDSLSSALEDLNRNLGTRYTLSHFGSWERGVRLPSIEAYAYLAQQVIRERLAEQAVPADVAEDVVRIVGLPERQQTKRQ